MNRGSARVLPQEVCSVDAGWPGALTQVQCPCSAHVLRGTLECGRAFPGAEAQDSWGLTTTCVPCAKLWPVALQATEWPACLSRPAVPSWSGVGVGGKLGPEWGLGQGSSSSCCSADTADPAVQNPRSGPRMAQEMG